MTRDVDYVVVGLGALGSADRLAAGAPRAIAWSGSSGSSSATRAAPRHDTRRILRHSYHTPAYVAADHRGVRRLGAARGASPASAGHRRRRARPVPAGLRDPARSTTPTSLDARRHRLRACSTPTTVAGAVAAVPAARRHRRAVPGATRRSCRPAAAPRAMQRQARAARRGRCATRRPVTARARPRRRTASRSRRRRHDVHVRAAWSSRADAWTNDVLGRLGVRAPADGHPGAGHLLRARATPTPFAPAGCRCGSGWTTRRTTGSPATARRPSRRRRTAAGPTVDRRRPDRRARPGDAGAAARRLHGADCCPAAAPPVRSHALPVHPHPGPRLRARRRCPATSRSWSGSAPAHGFKFAPTFGRLLADLAVDGRDRGRHRRRSGLDRPALTDPAYPAHWLV